MPTYFKQQGTENLAFSYSGGTFTLHGTGGRALSTSNPAYVYMPSNSSPGDTVRVTITGNRTFIDDAGASEIIGNTFGLTTSVAYGSDVPFYLYTVLSDDETEVATCISRIPHATTSPVTAALAAPDDPVATAQGDFWSIEDITETNFDENACMCIGSFRMTMSSSDDWTVSTLDDSDGINRFNDSTVFTMPTGVFGAATGTVIQANGGTAPVFSTYETEYTVSKDGICHIFYEMTDDGGANGAGTVSTLISLPFNPVFAGPFSGSARILDNNGTNSWVGVCQPQSSGNSFAILRTLTVGTTRFLQNADFINGSRQIQAGINYPIANVSTS